MKKILDNVTNTDPQYVYDKIMEIGPGNIWCKKHDRPLAFLVDPLYLTAWCRFENPLSRYTICSKILETGISNGCVLGIKNEKDM